MPKADPYFIEAAAKVLDILALFGEHDEIRLKDVMSRLGLVKSTAFRFLYTLEQKGAIERTPGGLSYRRVRRHRIGFVSISNDIPFVAEVERGIEREAARNGIELILRHHRFDSAALLAQVDELLASDIRLLLCYNPDEYVSHVLADRCANQRVPVVAITFPVPGARVFGVNNYRAGVVGGEGLGEHIARRWSGVLDRAVVLDIPGSSPAQGARITGMVEGLRTRVDLPEERILHLHPDRRTSTAEVAMREVLQAKGRPGRIAVLCYNDLNALGALRAVEAAGRTNDVAILSQGGVAEVREHVRRPRSAMWGAVAHFPERFGQGLIPVLLRLLRGETIPAATYTEHVLLTRSNIARYYPVPERD
ncbi:MAG: substrate-binding domain-containing protein [Bryobacteraceae bacterium]|nr:substrate-binding domain-containing protein [Bryobacteraceae bacterium]